ncbi:MAG: hypothetical protein LBU99_00920, partial [Spirochaetaceae bacterium]|nr:hypothetical protein [Spirochaetaceae bacterium]
MDTNKKQDQQRISVSLRRIPLIPIIGGALLMILWTSCPQQNVGFGEVIDFEPPVLTVTSILLPDGTEIPILEVDNKLTLGPGILVGPESILKGEARDNVLVTGIQVEETGPNAELIDGKPPLWTQAVISPRDASGRQTWSIPLNGIKKGERSI